MPSSPPADLGAARTWPTVSVVLPALNEERNLPLVLEGLPPVDEIVVVDGGSVDDTVAVAREVCPDALVIRQTRTGKGNALMCGFAVCSGDIVVTLNADGSTDPGEIPRYVDALLAGAEVAHGSRYREGGANLDEDRWQRIGRLGFNRAVNLFFGTRFTDLGYGFNAYWRELLPALDLPDPDARTPRRGARLWGEGPEIEPLINIRMATQGLRVVEVASVGYPRIYGISEHRPVRDGARAVRTAAGEYLRRWRISREASRHPGVHTFREERRTEGRRGARQRGPASRLAGMIPTMASPTGRHAAERRDADPTGRPPAVPRQTPAIAPPPPGSDPSAAPPRRRTPPDWADRGWADRGWADRGWTEQDRADQDRAGQDRAGQDRAAQQWAAQDRTEPDRAAREWAEQQWARDRWAEQKSWRETYADPGAVAVGGPRPQIGPHSDEASRPTGAPRRTRRRGPDLTVITGDRAQPSEGRAESPYLAALRAVPGESFGRD